MTVKEIQTGPPTAVTQTKKMRESGIELLKIIGILLVVISHVTQSLGADMAEELGPWEYFIDMEHAAGDLTTLLLILLRYTGILGNMIFFVCSAWFWVDTGKTNVRKLLGIVCDVFTVSVLWLIPFVLSVGIEGIGRDMLIYSLFPTYFKNNWYITNYIMFCFAVPFLNLIIRNIGKRTHFRIAAVLFVCFLCFPFLYRFPNANDMLGWTAVCFFISYFRRYGRDCCRSKKLNLVFLLSGLLGMLLLLLFTNFLGLKTGRFSAYMLHFINNNNPFNLLAAFGALNLFSKLKLRSKCVNGISGLSLLVYIIHENILFRTFIRTRIWQWIYTNYGFDRILLWLAGYVLLLFAVSLLAAFLYRLTVQKAVSAAADRIYRVLAKLFSSVSGFAFDRIS